MKHELALNNRVRDLRIRNHMRQTDLAQQIGVTRQTILAIEKGRLNPSIALCLRMARVLGEPVDYIFYLERRVRTVEGTAMVTFEETPEEKISKEPGAVFDFV